MFNIRSVDLNLLPVLEAVYEEQSLSRAAVRLAMTQSAVSHAVTRLRTVFRDELFVRQPEVLPTPTADLIYAKVRGGLGLVRERSPGTGFRPRTSTRQFFVTIPHRWADDRAALARARRRSRRGSRLCRYAVQPIDLDNALREGRTDATVDWLKPRGDSSTTMLFETLC
jgi:DNA-binding transcriptional LysR family regulator